jgi:hypothetical protein
MIEIQDLQQLREASFLEASRLGYTTNRALPLLELPESLRSVEDVIKRMLCMHAVSAVAHGFSRATATTWLENERLFGDLASSETDFIAGGGDQAAMQCLVDGLFALAWATNIEPAFDFAMDCPRTLARALPSFDVSGAEDALKQRVSLRGTREIVAMADLAYCLHWSIRDELLNKRRPPGQLHPIYVIERRRALEWLIGKSDWDDVDVST